MSTDDEQAGPGVVDNSPVTQWLGCIVPKRQARRAVTRNLLKRQMRECFHRHAAALPKGLWLLRLHAGFAVRDYPSARSEALAQNARAELERLLAAAASVKAR